MSGVRHRTALKCSKGHLVSSIGWAAPMEDDPNYSGEFERRRKDAERELRILRHDNPNKCCPECGSTVVDVEWGVVPDAVDMFPDLQVYEVMAPERSQH